MNHYEPHTSVTFEGYYSKFDLPSGAIVTLVISRVPGAAKGENYACLTYVPGDDGDIYQKELWPQTLKFEQNSTGDGFSLDTTDGQVCFEIRADEGTYTFHSEDVRFEAAFSKRTPWSSSTSTPEALLVYLPLPLHWHVQSLASACKFSLSLPHLRPSDAEGNAVVHQEKNWAQSFPAAHMWMQTRSGGRGIVLAGGRILGMDAFLVGYRNDETGLELDFRPPFALKVIGLSPFMHVHVDWDTRTLELTVQNFVHKLEIKAKAPKGSFYGLSAPFAKGHKENSLGQSMRATVEVTVYKRAWLFGSWGVVCRDSFHNAALEFGGDYYPPRGSENTRN